MLLARVPLVALAVMLDCDPVRENELLDSWSSSSRKRVVLNLLRKPGRITGGTPPLDPTLASELVLVDTIGDRAGIAPGGKGDGDDPGKF